MNVALIHKELENRGISVISVSEDGGITFGAGVTGKQKEEARAFIKNYKPSTRVEIEEKVRANQERLLMQLLIERFYPAYADGEASDGRKT